MTILYVAKFFAMNFDNEAPEASEEMSKEDPELVLVEEYLSLQTFNKDMAGDLEWVSSTACNQQAIV